MKQQLIKDNMNLVYHLVHRDYPTYTSDEDIIQCGMLGLCKAAEKWDETKSKFSTFAYNCIKNEIRQEFRRRAKHQGVLSLDYEVNGDDGEKCSFGDFIVAEEDISYVDLSVNYKLLTERELLIYNYLKLGMSNSDIGRKLGISRQTVWKTARKIRTLLGVDE